MEGLLSTRPTPSSSYNKADLLGSTDVSYLAELLLFRSCPLSLSIKELHQTEQEGCIRMSKKMQEYIYRELRGEIPGLSGDTRFGATVIPDINNATLVKRIADSLHEESEEEVDEVEEEEGQSALLLSDLDSQ